MVDTLVGDGLELDDTTLGAFVHTSHKALEEVFAVAGVTENSCVIDVGCGDGRAAIVAAERFRCRCVGGIDIGKELIERFEQRATAARSRAEQRTAAGAAGAASPCEHATRYFCVHGDALRWGEQEQLFLSPEQEAQCTPGCIHVSSDTVPGSSSRTDVFLPRPTHIYLYILQHMLKHLVPLMKRIRAFAPGVIIISAFEFQTREKLDAPRGSGDCEETLDVPVAKVFTESKGRISFRIYE